ncbi:hypothetical protein E3N88_15953 [Mikania micrantha]|uniref:Uncharacterized protein n=1 Tax=Mikania micrantha TaxID=192012 RepID=A0A5N6NZ49_9ASTR|nr:hypothetical protein E3N88_15953 [Mikania micrantha]
MRLLSLTISGSEASDDACLSCTGFHYGLIDSSSQVSHLATCSVSYVDGSQRSQVISTFVCIPFIQNIDTGSADGIGRAQSLPPQFAAPYQTVPSTLPVEAQPGPIFWQITV